MCGLALLVGGRLPGAIIDDVQVEFRTDSPFWVVVPGHEKEARYELSNPTGAPVEGMLEVSVTSFAGDIARAEVPVALPAKGTEKLMLPSSLFGSVGIKYLETKLRVGSEVRRLALRQFAYMNPVGNAVSAKDPFRFAMAGIRPQNDRELDLQLAATALIGAAVWRDSIPWPEVEPQPGQWSWAKVDRQLELAQKHSLVRQAVLTQTPRWALANPYREDAGLKRTVLYPGRTDSWRRYVRAVAERYRGKIPYWEIWNEPDLRSFFNGTTREYVQLLKIGYEELKDVDPKNMVMTGGFARAVPRPADAEGRGDLHRDAIAAAQGYFDVHAFHRHGMFPDFQRDVDGPLAEIRAQMREPKPLWFNETAMHSTMIGEREQARVLFKKMAFARSRGAMGYTWFNLVERSNYPVGDPERHYGAMLPDLQPKPVYVVYNELVRRLQGKVFVRGLDLGPGRWAFLFQGGAESVLLAWKEDVSTSDELWAVEASAAKTLIEVDLMGAEKVRPVVEEIAFVTLTKEPRFWVFSGAAEPKLVGRVFGSVKGEESASTVTLRNPWSRTLEIKLGAESVTVAPGASKELAVSAANLSYEFPQASLKGEFSLPSSSLLRIPPGPAGRREADIVISRTEQVTNVYEADPSRVDLNWKGPQDASARVWLSLNRTRQLQVRIEVTDDKIQVAGQEHSDADRVRVVFQPGNRSYTRSIEMALRKSGEMVVTQGVGATEALKDVVRAFSGKRTGKGAEYTLTIDLAALGFKELDLFERGVGFNVMVQDADTALAESFLQWKPGAIANTAGGEVVFPR